MPADIKTPDFDFRYIMANYANHFGRSVKSRASLEEILKDVLKVNLKVNDFVVSSYDIPVEARCHLGDRNTGVLGKNIQLGRTYVSATREFDVEIGPFSFAESRKWLPGDKGFDLINRLIVSYLDRPLDYTLTFIVIGDTVPKCVFGGKDISVRLGQGFLLGRRKEDENIKITIRASKLYAKRHRASFEQQEKEKWQN